MTWGFSAFTTSTAARSAYADYTGFIHVDQKLSCVGIAGYWSYEVREYQNSTLHFYSMAGGVFSTLDVITDVKLPNHRSSDKETLKAAGVMVEFGIEYQYNLSDHVFAHVSGGLHVTEKSALSNNKATYIDYPAVSWTGLKLQTGIGFRF